MTIDVGTILTTIVAGCLCFVASTLWRTVLVVQRLDEKAAQHEKRLDHLERVA